MLKGSYIFLEVPLGFAVGFGEDTLEDDLFVLAFFDGHVDERFHETFLFLLRVSSVFVRARIERQKEERKEIRN